MGRVAVAYGVRGALKVQPLSADPATLTQFGEWWLQTHDGGSWQAHRVTASRLQARMVVAELDGIATREAAAALRGASVGVPRQLLPALADDEHYRADLIGMTVVNRTGERLGEVVGFIDSGAHPIVRVAESGAPERLIPWVARYVDRVDTVARQIEVDWAADY
ncbi:MAG TPA: ribosome maturation factor RimM [Casimicrobiaceae bacterium]|nr:ribosome maturation factor RimM [Casimicrobiaceae bacterium]